LVISGQLRCHGILPNKRALTAAATVTWSGGRAIRKYAAIYFATVSSHANMALSHDVV
jgi:hypothetical protein